MTADDELVAIVEGRESPGGARMMRVVKDHLMALHREEKLVFLRTDTQASPTRFLVRAHGVTRSMPARAAAAWCLGFMDAGQR